MRDIAFLHQDRTRDLLHHSLALYHLHQSCAIVCILFLLLFLKHSSIIIRDISLILLERETHLRHIKCVANPPSTRIGMDSGSTLGGLPTKGVVAFHQPAINQESNGPIPAAAASCRPSRGRAACATCGGASGKGRLVLVRFTIGSWR